MPVKKIELADIGTVHLYKRRGTKSLRLSINHGGIIRVSMPPWVPYRMGLEFVLKKRDWLETKRQKPLLLQSGQRIGKAHHLLFTHQPDRQQIRSQLLSSGEIRISLPLDVQADDLTAQHNAQRACIRALRQEAEGLLPGRLAVLARNHGFSYRSVSVKRLSSRWGSCSEHHDLVLNSYLMQLPWELIDYVLLHELLHTQIMAHGTEFWSALAKHVPELKRIRKDIRQYQPRLIPQ